MRNKERKNYTESDLKNIKDSHLAKAKFILKSTLNTANNFTNIDIDFTQKLNNINNDIENASNIEQIELLSDKTNKLILELVNKKPEKKAKDIKKGYFISEFSYYSDIISDLLSSIKTNVELTASPLAQSIYELKRESSKFLKTFTNWKDEINDPNSNLNHNHVVSSFQFQSQRFTEFGDHIGKDFQYITASLRRVEEMFNKISDITKHIDDIASNIKTLSINASIEAARAGEQGKGFAVVAVEVRKLAKRSDKASSQIGEIIKLSNKKVEDGVGIANNAGKMLNQIKNAVTEVATLIEEISTSSSEQLASIGQINEVLIDLDTNTQENSSLAEQVASSTEELSAQSVELNNSMKFFKV